MGRHSANNSGFSGRDARRGTNQPTRRRSKTSNTRYRNDSSPLDDIRDLNYDSARARRAGSLERAPERLQGELKRRKHRGRRIAALVGRAHRGLFGADRQGHGGGIHHRHD